MLGRALSRLACVCLLTGCGDGRYVIGRFVDSGCAERPDAIFCSGFELPDLSEWDESVVVNSAQVSQTEALRRSGRGALHASSTAAESAGAVSVEFPRLDAGELFLRVFMYVPGSVDTMTPNVMFIGDVPAPDPFKGVDFNFEAGAPEIFLPENDPNRFTSTLLVIPRDAWFCYQVRLSIAEDEGAVSISVDGEVALEESGLDTLPEGGVHLLRAGVDWSSKQESRFEIYMDDLVLSSVELPCEDP
ncbi:MAG TPA: hypothetical protein VGK73_23495 [Polyangiaceae bacterium]